MNGDRADEAVGPLLPTLTPTEPETPPPEDEDRGLQLSDFRVHYFAPKDNDQA